MASYGFKCPMCQIPFTTVWWKSKYSELMSKPMTYELRMLVRSISARPQP